MIVVENCYDISTQSYYHDALDLSMFYQKHELCFVKNMSSKSKHDRIKVEETVKVWLSMCHKKVANMYKKVRYVMQNWIVEVFDSYRDITFIVISK